jgi:phosphate transporter
VKSFVQVMFSPVIMLLLGGFAIASALSKHYIAKAVATSIMQHVNKPSNVVLTSMFIATFFSMWISNVAAPTLCFTLVQPILRREISNRKLCKVCTGSNLLPGTRASSLRISFPTYCLVHATMHVDGQYIPESLWFAL